MLDAGLLSSKYPFPSFSVSLPTRMDAPLFATPCKIRETNQHANVHHHHQLILIFMYIINQSRNGACVRTQRKVLMSAVSWRPVRRRSFPSPYAAMCSLCFNPSFSMAFLMISYPPSSLMDLVLHPCRHNHISLVIQ